MKILSEEQKALYLDQLKAFLRIPSVSSLPDHASDMGEAANWLTEFLHKSGFAKSDIKLLYGKALEKENTHPVVFAERIDDPTNSTILIYGHYDVQPVEPLDEWKSKPFEPEVRDGKIFARGATDNKGQLMTHLAALHLLAEEWGEKWPINVKVLVEGEEESGGAHLEALIHEHADDTLFAADVCLISDTQFLAPDKPAIEVGLRGITYLQIDVTGPEHDLHSGLYGGAVMNPAQALSWILAQLQNQKSGKILVPGVYDEVSDLPEDERQALATSAFSEEVFLEGAGKAFGEHGYTTHERTTIRPALDINGLWYGYQGEGAKTVIGKSAHAKLSVRTVGEQDPDAVGKRVIDCIQSIAPKEVSVQVEQLESGKGVALEATIPAVQKAAEALEEVFGEAPVFTRSGGSIPVVSLIKNVLGIDPVLIGYGLPDDNLHAPNEKFDLEQFYKGIVCNVILYKRLQK